jgi:formamidopyrimidine-DNA glycosylase
VTDTISTAVSLGGRESERDLYGKPGNYRPLMDQHARGKPCSVCGWPIERISCLGGSCYVCPACQT